MNVCVNIYTSTNLLSICSFTTSYGSQAVAKFDYTSIIANELEIALPMNGTIHIHTYMSVYYITKICTSCTTTIQYII